MTTSISLDDETIRRIAAKVPDNSNSPDIKSKWTTFLTDLIQKELKPFLEEVVEDQVQLMLASFEKPAIKYHIESDTDSDEELQVPVGTVTPTCKKQMSKTYQFGLFKGAVRYPRTTFTEKRPPKPADPIDAITTWANKKMNGFLGYHHDIAGGYLGASENTIKPHFYMITFEHWFKVCARTIKLRGHPTKKHALSYFAKLFLYVHNIDPLCHESFLEHLDVITNCYVKHEQVELFPDDP